MIDTYFNDGKVTKRTVQDWDNIHFLSIDKYYTDGDLNLGKVIDKYGSIETIDIDLSNTLPKYNENDWNIKGSSYKSKSRTFNFYKFNSNYRITNLKDAYYNHFAWIIGNKDTKRIMDNEADGSAKVAESIKNELVVQDYSNIPKSKKEKTGHADRH